MAKMIKHSLIAGAALASLAGAVQAQSVTLFGRIDVGVEYNSKSGNNQDGIVHLRDGGIRPSIWGLKGSEDLGGGLKAVFNLESDFGGDTGGERFDGTLVPFGRQANVGLSGGFGTVLLGRQYSPAILAEFGVEPRAFKESHSGLLQYAVTQLPDGNGLSGRNWGGIFTGNSISYSNAFGPVNVGVLYGFGENSPTNKGRTYALGLSYNGPVTVGASFQQIEGQDDAETSRYAIGVAVPFGSLTGKVHYAHSTLDDTTGAEVVKTDHLGVGVDLAWNAQNTATIAYYYGKEKYAGSSPKTKSLVVSNDYALSKRTTLYAQLVYADVDAGIGLLNIAPNLGGPSYAVVDEKTTIFGVGVSHNF